MKPDLRLVSLLPSATEMACALGLEDRLLAVTHCCDYPPGIHSKPRVVHSRIPVHELGLREIDDAVTRCLQAGESLYAVDESMLRELAPTHLLTQDLCQVCAPSGNEVSRVLNSLTPRPEVLWMSPHTLADIENDLLALGRATGCDSRAADLVRVGRERLDAVRARVASVTDPVRVFCAEWVDPLFCSGHWVPEMVRIAGGIDPLGRMGADSVRIEWEQVRGTEPEVVILMLCGFDTESAAAHLRWLESQPGWEEIPAVRSGRVFAVDAGYFSRPGPRVIDGTELLAHLLHPEVCEWRGPSGAFRPLR